MVQFDVPANDPGDSHFWVVGCYDSRDGSFRELNYLIDFEPDSASTCI